MIDSRSLLGRAYRDLYSGYYQGNALAKRERSAAQTVDQMQRVLGDLVVDKLIDVGAGEGSVLQQIGRRGLARELHATEISASGVAAIKTKEIPLLFAVQVFDGYKIPYADKHFDLAITIHVLEHVEHERLFLREIGRVSRRAYIEVPLEHGFRIRRSIAAGTQYGHINFYMKATLRSLLESSGLTVTECGVFASSLKYEQCISGRAKGWFKHLVRTAALQVAPSLAPWFVAYNGYALCECN
jgi:ubiquinone/menaquinone biosynthesis C-methylase UbiE